MHVHRSRSAVVKQACAAIRNIVARNPELRDVLHRALLHAFHVPQSFLGEGVEAQLRQALATHPSCADFANAALRDLGCDVELKVWMNVTAPVPSCDARCCGPARARASHTTDALGGCDANRNFSEAGHNTLPARWPSTPGRNPFVRITAVESHRRYHISSPRIFSRSSKPNGLGGSAQLEACGHERARRLRCRPS